MSIFPEFIIKPFRPYLRAILGVQGSASLANTVLYSMYRESLLSCERNRDPKRLLKYGFRAYSQHDEDGMIYEIFDRIGVSNRTFLEFGVGDGTENNTLYLLLAGWRGLWIDGNDTNAASINPQFSSFIQSDKLTFLNRFVSRDSINEIIEKGREGLPGEIDLLSIDIDGNDYWVWEALSQVQPRVVVVEYNAVFRPPHRGSCRLRRTLCVGRHKLLRSKPEGARIARLTKGLRSRWLFTFGHKCLFRQA